MAQQAVKLQSFADLTPYMEGFELVSTQWGADGRVYVLLIDQFPERDKGMFVQAKLHKQRLYRVLVLTDHVVNDVIIWSSFNYHYIQPLHEHLLLVGARCRYYGRNQYDLNARVYDYEGLTVDEFLLGDGIQDVQVSEEGMIWTSYFDEGVFGNYGWSEPVGASGLLAWDHQGKRTYENQAVDIADCYALNVVKDQEVWFYYYTDFSLGCITGGTQQPNVTLMNPGISGSSGFCTDGYHFLFDGGYGRHGTYVLKKLEHSRHLMKGTKITFRNEQARQLQVQAQCFRQNRLLLYSGQLLYQVTVEEIAEHLGNLA